MFISTIKVPFKEREIVQALSEIPDLQLSWNISSSKKQNLIQAIGDNIKDNLIARTTFDDFRFYPKISQKLFSLRTDRIWDTYTLHAPRPPYDLLSLFGQEPLTREGQSSNSASWAPKWIKPCIKNLHNLVSPSTKTLCLTSHWSAKTFPRLETSAHSSGNSMQAQWRFIPLDDEEKTKSDLGATGGVEVFEGGAYESIVSKLSLTADVCKKIDSSLASIARTKDYKILYRYFRTIQRRAFKSGAPLIIDTIPAVEVSVKMSEFTRPTDDNHPVYISVNQGTSKGLQQGTAAKVTFDTLRLTEINRVQLDQTLPIQVKDFDEALIYAEQSVPRNETKLERKDSKTSVRVGVYILIVSADLMVRVEGKAPSTPAIGTTDTYWIPASKMDIDCLMALRDQSPLTSLNGSIVQLPGTEGLPVLIQISPTPVAGGITGFGSIPDIAIKLKNSVSANMASFYASEILRAHQVLVKGGIKNTLPEELHSVDRDCLELALFAVASAMPVPMYVVGHSITRASFSILRKLKTKNVIVY